MRNLIYICGTTALAVAAILAFSQNGGVSTHANSDPVPVISQETTGAATTTTSSPLPLEQWDAF